MLRSASYELDDLNFKCKHHFISAGCQRTCRRSFAFRACSCCSQKRRLKESSGYFCWISPVNSFITPVRSSCNCGSKFTPCSWVSFFIASFSFLSAATERALRFLYRCCFSGVLSNRKLILLVLEVCRFGDIFFCATHL